MTPLQVAPEGRRCVPNENTQKKYNSIKYEHNTFHGLCPLLQTYAY
jgi:hypothetical protein